LARQVPLSILAIAIILRAHIRLERGIKVYVTGSGWLITVAGIWSEEFTGVFSSLRGVEAIEDQSAYETNISHCGRTNSRNGKVSSTANDISPWIEPLHC
jgi:hypothetical protein